MLVRPCLDCGMQLEEGDVVCARGGLWTLVPKAGVWWVLMADDANPYMVGIFANLLLTSALLVVTSSGSLSGP